MGLGFGALAARLDRHALARRAAAAAQAPMRRPTRNARWIVGRGWNQELWADQALPDRRRPRRGRRRPAGRGSSASTAMPLVANSAAMKAAGVTAATTAPAGGDGSTNGLFVDAAMELVEPQGPRRRRRRRPMRRWPRRRNDAVGYGLTAAADMGTSAERLGGDAPRRRGGHAQRPHHELCRRACRRSRRSTATGRPMALRRPAADGRGQALRRRRARLARRLAEAPYADKPDTRGLQLPQRRRAARTGRARPRRRASSSRSTRSATPPTRR